VDNGGYIRIAYLGKRRHSLRRSISDDAHHILFRSRDS
jgi:hypothetical protein